MDYADINRGAVSTPVILYIFLLVLLSCVSRQGLAVEKFSEQEQDRWHQAVIAFVVREKQWDEEDFTVSFKGINETYSIAIFQVSHLDALREKLSEIRTAGRVNTMGLRDRECSVFVDIHDLEVLNNDNKGVARIRKKRQARKE